MTCSWHCSRASKAAAWLFRRRARPEAVVESRRFYPRLNPSYSHLYAEVSSRHSQLSEHDRRHILISPTELGTVLSM